MENQKLEKLLRELAGRTAEPIAPDLAEDIKGQIPSRLAHRRAGMNAINIVIDLRVSKLAAAAVIVISLFLCLRFFGGRDLTGDNLYEESKLFINYCLGNKTADRGSELASVLYEYLVSQGIEPVYYGDRVDISDSNAVVMYWRLSDGGYMVRFGGDLRAEAVTAEELIELQGRMLQKRTR